MRRVVALVVISIVLPHVGLSQVIARQDLDRFRCGLVLGPGEDERQVVGGGFLYWNVGWPEEASPTTKGEDGRRIYEMVYIEADAQARPTGDGSLLFVPLQARSRTQFQPYVLSVWEADGDSLRLATIDTVARVNQANHGNRLSETRQSADGGYLIVSESDSGDEDLRCGKLEVLRYEREERKLHRVYTATYRHCFTMRSDTLAAGWYEKDGEDYLRLVRRTTEAVQDPVSVWRTHTVSAETTYLGVEELAKRRP